MRQQLGENVFVIVPDAKKSLYQCSKSQNQFDYPEFNYSFVFEDEKYTINSLTFQMDSQPKMNNSDQFVMYFLPPLRTVFAHFDDPRAYFRAQPHQNGKATQLQTSDALLRLVQRAAENIMERRIYVDNQNPLALLELRVAIMAEVLQAPSWRAERHIQVLFDCFSDMIAKHSLNEVYRHLLEHRNIQVETEVEYYN